MPLFSKSKALQSRKPPSLIPKCGACGLYKGCNSPKMEVSGKGRKKILVVGEAPGENEDDKGIQFCGRAGRHLEDTLMGLGIDMRRDCWLTNALICRPPDNASPTTEQIEYCLPNLRRTIKELKPVVIIPVGYPATKAVLKDPWQQTVDKISVWTGWRIPCQLYNAWICPNFHPSYILRELKQAKSGTAVDLLFERHLKRAVAKTKRPWKEVPDYASQVEVLLDSNDAIPILKMFRKKGGVISFDYETSMLKPDYNYSRANQGHVKTVSVCWRGERTIAFPFTGPAMFDFIKLLESDCPKISHNLKFEDRWTSGNIHNKWVKSEDDKGHHEPDPLHPTVKNWAWDSMVNAHLADNRRGITALDFQAFIHFGQTPWGLHISPFLHAEGSYEPNKIDQVDLSDLLLYNGLDSLLAYMITQKQRKMFGFKPF